MKLFKLVLPFLFTLILLGSSFAHSTSNENNGSEDDEAIHKIATTIYDAFTSYKLKEMAECADMMKMLNFSLTKEISRSVPGNSTVDSLIFENSDGYKWAYYKSVDLDYLRSVEVFFVIKHENSDRLANILSDQLVRTYDLTTIENMDGQYKVTVEDKKGASVVDERFSAKPVSKIASLYTYSLTASGEYLIVEFREILPKTVLESNDHAEPFLAKSE